MVSPGLAQRLALRLLNTARNDLAGWWTALRSPLPTRPGLLTYRLHPPGGERRIHLRVDPRGAALLMVDATDTIHLNPTAALLARWALEKTPPARAAHRLRKQYRCGDRAQIERDVRRVYALIDHLSTTTEACPTCGLGNSDRVPLFSTPVGAPYKADLALTYGCNNTCGHCYNPPRRTGMPSLALDDWRRVLEKLAAVGVPRVIFTGGEPTLFAGLNRLIARADRLGMMTGLNTNGRRLADRAFARSLHESGLSHVQVTLASCRRDVHNAITGAASFDETVAGIRAALDVGLHTITNTTLNRHNADHAEQTVEFLHALGVRTFAVNGMIRSGRGRANPDAIAEDRLGPLIVQVRDRAAELGMRFLWYTPTAWCRLSPEELQVGPRRCNAAQYSIGIEPNGDVLPCQSYYQPVGNILRDPWKTIWEAPLFRRIRRRVADPAAAGLPEACWRCPDLTVCGGGCPLERNVE
jgi:radical SAM protein with 4Fe4S-binding SPASM domain